LSKDGWHIDFVSPKGGYTPLEPESLQLGTNEIDWKMYADPVFRDKLAKTHKPSELDSSHYDCMFFTGGHGVVFDFYKNKEL
jgi:putative intracellular protease/amidase